ncbi:hypothetical protein ACFVX3_19575 [Rhodococcus erythropolis]
MSEDKRVVWDGAASVFAVAGWVLIGAVFYSRRRKLPSDRKWSMPVTAVTVHAPRALADREATEGATLGGIDWGR